MDSCSSLADFYFAAKQVRKAALTLSRFTGKLCHKGTIFTLRKLDERRFDLVGRLEFAQALGAGAQFTRGLETSQQQHAYNAEFLL